jgi:hypothetical protein
VEVHPGPDDGAFPAEIEVEGAHPLIHGGLLDEAAEDDARMPRTLRGGRPSASAVGTRRGAGASAADVDLSGIEKVNRFPNGLRR